MKLAQDDALPVTWKQYVFAGAQFLGIFYLATFCMGVLFLRRGENWHLLGIVLGILYGFIIVIAAIRMLRKLSMAAVMVASPTIPLCMLIIVVSLLPTLQSLDKYMHWHPDKESLVQGH